MQGYKVDVSDYNFETVIEVVEQGKLVLDESTGEAKVEKKCLRVKVNITFPLMLTNPQLGAVGGQPPADFDLYELGTIGKMIERSEDFVILDQAQYDLLVSRTKQIQKHLNYKYFEMVRRVMNAEKVELGEKK